MAAAEPIRIHVLLQIEGEESTNDLGVVTIRPTAVTPGADGSPEYSVDLDQLRKAVFSVVGKIGRPA